MTFMTEKSTYNQSISILPSNDDCQLPTSVKNCNVDDTTMPVELTNWQQFGLIFPIGLALFVLFIIFLASALYISRTLFAARASTNSMQGKVVLITGANSGIGKETAREMARLGARVIMACRTMSTAIAARDEIKIETGNKNVEALHLDLGLFASIREFCDKILTKETRLDVLIHNAACGHVFNKILSADGLDLTMATNHFGPFLLTHLLIDLLKKSAPSRIVIVASKAYRLSTLDLDNLNPNNKLPMYLYSLSKYANIVFAFELARRLQGTGVTANSLHPGTIDSGIWRNVPFPLSIPIKFMMVCLFKNVVQGAQTTIHVASANELLGVTGKYFRDCKISDVVARAKDPDVGKKLWENTVKLVHLKPSDPKI